MRRLLANLLLMFTAEELDANAALSVNCGDSATLNPWRMSAMTMRAVVIRRGPSMPTYGMAGQRLFQLRVAAMTGGCRPRRALHIP